MEKIFEIQNQKTYVPNIKFGGNSVAEISKTSPIPNDSFESKTKKESKNDVFLASAGILGLALTGVLGAKKYYKYKNNHLPCGINKNEIREEFFNFIKKNDPKCDYFFSRNKILELEKNMDEDKFLILKKLYRMNEENVLRSFNDKSFKRFTLEELSDFLKITDSENIQFLEQLSTKQYKSDSGYVKKFSPDEIRAVLLKINNENKAVAKEVIDCYNLSNYMSTPAQIETCLKNINNDNIEIYKMLLSSRKNGNNTNLTYDNMQELASIIKEQNNPKTAELLLNIKKENGTGQFAYKINDIKNILNNTKDENIELYEKLFKNVGIMDFNKDYSTLAKEINTKNIDRLIQLANLKTKDSEFVFSKGSEIIELANTTSNFNTEQNDVLNTILNKYEIDSSSRTYIKTIIEFISDAQNLPKIKEEITKTNNLFNLQFNLKY